MSTDNLPIDVKFSLSWCHLLPVWLLSQLLCFMFFQNLMVHVLLFLFGLFIFNCPLFSFKISILAAGYMYIFIINAYLVVHFFCILKRIILL